MLTSAESCTKVMLPLAQQWAGQEAGEEVEEELNTSRWIELNIIAYT
jgi:hypothetical protein